MAHKRLDYDYGRVDGDLANQSGQHLFTEVQRSCGTLILPHPADHSHTLWRSQDIMTLTLNRVPGGLDIIECR